MSYTVYEEDVIYDLKNYFKNNLDTYLTGIETAQGDGVDLANIKAYDVETRILMR
jgi:hypothetical protein